MRDATKDETLRLPDIEAIRSHVKATDVVRLVVIDRVGDVRIHEAVERDLAISDFVNIDHVIHFL